MTMAMASKKKRANGNPGTTVNGIAEVKDLLTQFESYIKEAEALAAMEIRRIEEIKEALKAGLARLGTQIKEKEELIRSRDTALREMEETFTAKIHDLENKLREKEALLTVRDTSEKNFDYEMDAANMPGEPHFTLGDRAAAPVRNLERWLRQGIQAGRQGGEETRNSQERGPVGQEQKSSRLGSLLAPTKRRT
jgi:vacuolar-type H+-ATPase subunit I/STV1